MDQSFSLTADGEWLTFRRGGGNKWYAKTPDGEYAWSDVQGLYEWTHDKNGQLARIAYTGGDRQASDRNGKWTLHARPEPNIRGFRYAIGQLIPPMN